MKLNLPNKLTLLRVIMIPLFMFFIIFPVFGDVISPIVATVIFILTALTDMLDGKIARKYNLITNFGKFLDPLADKCMVLGGFIGLLCVANVRGELYSKVLAWSFLDVIKVADHIIDLGPEGGNKGGEIVATGTPEEVAKSDKSYTGLYLKKILKK